MRPAPLGGAQRAPAKGVELPALGGRPKSITFEAVWKAVEATLQAAPPASLEAAIGAFGELGFSLAKSKDGHAKLRRGDFELHLEADPIGSHPALRLELEGPSRGEKIERTAVEMHGTLIPEKLFDRMQERYEKVYEDFRDAFDDNGKKPLPTTFDKLKTFIDSGKSGKAQAKEEAQDAEVAAAVGELKTKLEQLAKQGRAPRAVVVYTDGPDGAGKSSTGTIVLEALAASGYTTDAVSFKAPTAKERSQHWLQRFRDRGVPTGQLEARFWDRGPAGDAVYGKKTPAEVKVMARELRELERELAKDGVLLFKVHIYADQEKQAETFGKRLGRQSAADVIEAELVKRGKLTPASAAALENIRSKIDGDDLQALVNFDEHQSKFLRFSKAAGYTVVDATKRHAARLEIIEAFVEQLEAHAKAHKPS